MLRVLQWKTHGFFVLPVRRVIVEYIASSDKGHNNLDSHLSLTVGPTMLVTCAILYVIISVPVVLGSDFAI